MGGLVGKRRTGRVTLADYGAGGQLGGLDLGRGAALPWRSSSVPARADKDQRGGGKNQAALSAIESGGASPKPRTFRADTIRQHPAAPFRWIFLYRLKYTVPCDNMQGDSTNFMLYKNGIFGRRQGSHHKNLQLVPAAKANYHISSCNLQTVIL